MGKITPKDRILSFKPHDHYFIYVDNYKNYLDITKDNFYFFFSKPDNWNDSVDLESTKKKDNSSDFYYFYRCLSYFKSESIAMWHIYAKEKGLCFELSPGPIKQIAELKFDKIELVNKTECKDYDFKTYDIEFSNVIYYGEDDKKKGLYVINRSTSKTTISENKLNTIKKKYYTKDIGWNYECECRLILKIPKAHISDYGNIIGIKVYLKNNKKHTKICYTSPFAKDIKYDEMKMELTKSKFDGIVNFKK